MRLTTEVRRLAPHVPDPALRPLFGIGFSAWHGHCQTHRGIEGAGFRLGTNYLQRVLAQFCLLCTSSTVAGAAMPFQ